MTMIPPYKGTDPFAKRTHLEMTDVLMKPEEKGPDVHYYMIRGGSDKKNITVWESGEVGGEYIKTYGHYHVTDLGETYEILFGSGILLLQERKLDDNGRPLNDELVSFKAIFAKEGDKIYIPGNIGHLMVNIGKNWLVTADDSPVALTPEEKASWPTHADYGSVKEVHGFGYYVINEGGEPKFVKNPLYKNVPDVVIENASQ